MKASRPLAFVVLAFVIGATISQASFAFADDSSTNPFRAIWQAISELQSKTDSLQAQIDDLKAQRVVVAPEQADAKVSEPSIGIEVGPGEAGQTLLTLTAKNAGPENAVGVKLSTYYQTTLFHVNSIQGADCTDQARGIIECLLRTIDAGSEVKVTISATPSILGQQAVVTTDISSLTKDANLANNHAEAVFVTSEAPVAIQPTTPPQITPQIPASQSQGEIQTQPAAQNSTSQMPVQQPQNQTQTVQQPQNQTQILPAQPSAVEQQPQNQTSSQPVEQQSQNQTQSQPVQQQPENQTQAQPPAEQQPQQPLAEQPPAEQSQPSSGGQSDQGSTGSSDSGSPPSSGSGDTGTSGGQSSPPPSGGSDTGATG